VNLTALAAIAGKLGYSVSAEDVTKQIQTLSSEENSANSSPSVPVSRQAQLTGIPESDLRQEVHDGLLVEKMVQGSTRECSRKKRCASCIRKAQSFFWTRPWFVRGKCIVRWLARDAQRPATGV